MKKNPLVALESFGQSVWLDYLGRGAIKSGQLQCLIEQDGVSGVTSNPSIFEKAIAESHDYDGAIHALALQNRSAQEIYQALTVEDIQAAADLFRPTYDRTNGGDGYVSLEVSPHLARDTQGTIADARRLWTAAKRPNLFIKVPATREGLPAIRQLISESINVNITLLFGLPRYRDVADAYLKGLESLAAQRKPLSKIASVASFFLSRIDVLVDPRFEKLMSASGAQAEVATRLHGQVAIASARVARQIYQEIFESDRFRKLAGSGARTQRLLWASTSTKNPAYPDLKYVEPLIGPDTINTMPLETLEAYRDHGQPALTLGEGVAEAHTTLRQLPELGIDLDQVTQQLEDEGISKFNKAFDLLMETLQKARQAPLNRQLATR
jgi:transaldolase